MRKKLLVNSTSTFLKEEGHYFPYLAPKVPSAPSFKVTYVQNYQKYSYIVICWQVAFFMLFSNQKDLGRSKSFWAELGRNNKHQICKMSLFHQFWRHKMDFGPPKNAILSTLNALKVIYKHLLYFGWTCILLLAWFLGWIPLLELRDPLKMTKMLENELKTIFST